VLSVHRLVDPFEDQRLGVTDPPGAAVGFTRPNGRTRNTTGSYTCARKTRSTSAASSGPTGRPR